MRLGEPGPPPPPPPPALPPLLPPPPLIALKVAVTDAVASKVTEQLAFAGTSRRTGAPKWKKLCELKVR
jgi:hypothetical protein